MTTCVLTYKGYTAEIGLDDSADAFHGHVVGLADVIDFYGRSVDELRAAFADSIEDYLDMCAADGVEAERPSRCR